MNRKYLLLILVILINLSNCYDDYQSSAENDEKHFYIQSSMEYSIYDLRPSNWETEHSEYSEGDYHGYSDVYLREQLYSADAGNEYYMVDRVVEQEYIRRRRQPISYYTIMSMQKYNQEYEELEVVGRGQYGVAYLINHKAENKLYVAKKIQLQQLNQKEIEQSKQEVALLRRLQHPNIVQYIDSFVEEEVLYVIMEYCEEGDMQFHVKRKQQKKESFDEELVLNWFLQITMALQYLHSQKTSNIFLAANGTVKIGDFGISKVLESTLQQAQTVVGTPYYMSPEVCENQPYTFKSDVWALGCVLHELCSLSYAFQANNLLSLVFKIVKDQPMRIPTSYSTEIQNMIDWIMDKDQARRPGIMQILQNKFVQKVMLKFINANGKLQSKPSIHIKPTQTHKVLKKIVNDEPKMEGPEETAYQKMMKRKQKVMLAKEEQLRQAAIQNATNSGFAKKKKMENLFGRDFQQHQMQSDYGRESQREQTMQSQRQLESTDATVQSISVGQNTLNNLTVNQASDPLDDLTLQSLNYSKTYHQNLQMLKEQDQLTNQFKDLTLRQSGNQLQETQLEYEDDFEEYNTSDDDEDIRFTSKAGDKELNQVVNVYKSLLDANGETEYTQNFTTNYDVTNTYGNLDYDPKKYMSAPSNEASLNLNQSVIVNSNSKMTQLRAKCINSLGNEKFNQAYFTIKNDRSLGMPEDEIQQKLLQIVGKKNLSLCFEIDQIIYLEGSQ